MWLMLPEDEIEIILFMLVGVVDKQQMWRSGIVDKWRKYIFHSSLLFFGLNWGVFDILGKEFASLKMGKEVRIMLEEDGYFDGKGFHFIGGREKKLINIKFQ